MSRKPRWTSYDVYEDPPQAPPPNHSSVTGSVSNESSSSSNSSVPEHHHAVASTPHPYRRADDRPRPTMRDLRRIRNDENIRQNTIAGSRTGSSYSNTSVASGQSVTGLGGNGSTSSASDRSATGAESNESYGSSQYYYNNTQLDQFPTHPSHPHFYDRENLRPVPLVAPHSPHRVRLNAYPNQFGAVSDSDLMGPRPPPPADLMVPMNQSQNQPMAPYQPVVENYPMAQNYPMPPNYPTAPVQHYVQMVPMVQHPAGRQSTWAQGPGPRPADSRRESRPRSPHHHQQQQQVVPQSEPPRRRANANNSYAAPSGPPASPHRSQRSQRSARRSGSGTRSASAAPAPGHTTRHTTAGKIKVSIKLKSLRIIVSELSKEDDEVVIEMSVPDAALEDYTRTPRPRPPRPPPGGGRTPKRRVHRDVNE